MKFRFVKSEDKEEVVVYGKSQTELVNKIKALCDEEKTLIGYDNNKFKELNISEIECFITTDDKVYAITKNGNYLIKKRLYELDKTTLNTFTYINQGCLANLKEVDHFEVSFGGALLVVFKSGYKDYVSRRQLKIVKERIGLKK